MPSLIEAICRAVTKPAIVAGSVDRPEQIAVIGKSGAAGFTVGTSTLDGRFPAGQAMSTKIPESGAHSKTRCLSLTPCFASAPLSSIEKQLQARENGATLTA